LNPATNGRWNLLYDTDVTIDAGCSKRLSSKAAASEEARRTLRYVEPLSDARTPLADFFGIPLGRIGLRYQGADRVLISPRLVGLQHSGDRGHHSFFCHERHFDAYSATLVTAE
jgi:hypothetical protein